jgi:hypothetical protein
MPACERAYYRIAKHYYEAFAALYAESLYKNIYRYSFKIFQ